jgi:drug/metabolite transporter (DMT)-like permease
MTRTQSTWLLHFTVIIFGFTGILGKLITLPADRLVFWRVLIGGGLIALWLIVRGRLKRFPKGVRWKVVGVGWIAAAHWVTFFASIQISTVSVALATLAVTPLFVSFLEPLIHKRKVDVREIALGIVILLGLLLVLFAPGLESGGISAAWSGFTEGGDHVVGVGLALVSAALAGLFSVLNSVLVKQYDSANLSRLELLGAAMGLALLFALQGDLFERSFWAISAQDWIWIGLLATVATSFAYLASIEVMRQLTPFTIALAINMEPVYSIVFAAWFFDEAKGLNGWFYLGAATIIGTVFINSVWKSWRRRRTNRMQSFVNPQA